MKIYHLVLFRFKKGVSETQIKTLDEKLLTLRSLKGVVELTSGKNFSTRAQNWDHGLTVIFESKEALQHYQESQLHTDVKANFITPITEDLLVLDYEQSLL